MKIMIIGSGSIFAKNNSASYLIDNDILIDAPNGVCKSLRNLNIMPNSINHILITHFHGDHYFDLPLYLLDKFYFGDKKTNIYTNKIGLKKIYSLTSLAFTSLVDKLKNDQIINHISSRSFKINGYDIKRVVVSHGDIKPAYGYIFKRDNITIGFTGDACYSKIIDNMAKRCDYLICDCNSIVGTEKHMGIDNITYLAKKYNNHKFIVSHMGDDVRIKLLEKKETNIIVPNDGDVFNI